MAVIHFRAKPVKIGSCLIIKLPLAVSSQLPSRGLVLGKGRINGIDYQKLLEPDGRGSHWFVVDDKLAETAGINLRDRAELELEPGRDWPEPDMPDDFRREVLSSQQAEAVWRSITPKSRWEWLRWVRSTANPTTRLRRLAVARQKLETNQHRPCCFNASMCTEPTLSVNGRLVEADSED